MHAAEVVLGGWGNTRSTIRESNQGRNMLDGLGCVGTLCQTVCGTDCCRGGTVCSDGLLSATEPTEFWASAVGGLVRVGLGSRLGEDTLFSWQDPDHHVVTHVGAMTGWGATGEWTICSDGSPVSVASSSTERYVRVSTQLSWHDARDHCRALGRDLASVHSADENEAIWRLTGGQSDWIGMSDEVNERTAETGILTLPAHVD